MNALQDAKATVHQAQNRVDALTSQQASVAAELLNAQAALRAAHTALNKVKADDARLLVRHRKDELQALRDRIETAAQSLAAQVDPVQAALDRANFSPENIGPQLHGADLTTEQAHELSARADQRFRVRVGQLVASKAWHTLDTYAQFDTLTAALAAARGEELRILADMTGAQ